MAVITNPGEFSTDIKVGPKAATVALYLVIGAVAMAVAIPAALATADAGMFEECYSACVAATELAAK